MKLLRRLALLLGLAPAMQAGATPPPGVPADDAAADRFWNENYDARQRYFEGTLGPFPQDILKMLNMVGVWPGGGLYVVPAVKLHSGLTAYLSFGLSNPDMPATTRMTEATVEHDSQGRPSRSSGTLQRKETAPHRAGAAGYGYEMLVLTPEPGDWALGFLQWAVNAEISKDVGFLDRMDRYQGLTVEQIQVAPGQAVNVLIARARPPLPTGTTLPAGTMEVLVATVITEEEMRWSVQNGRDALLHKLTEAGVGQVSRLKRASVVR